MRISRVLSLLLFITLSHPAGIEGRTPVVPSRTDTPPVIDGVLDDRAWSGGPAISGFMTWMPDYGREPGDVTEARVAYDGENLYFGFRCADSSPEMIKASVTSRDNIADDDWVAIHLDSFGNSQSHYSFYVNPLGIQMDARTSGGEEDLGIDIVWFSKGLIDDRGFAVEIAIPLKSIRYQAGDRTAMRFLLERHVSRRSELSTSPPLDPARGPSFLTQMDDIVFEGIGRDDILEVLPALTYSRDRLEAVQDGDPVKEKIDESLTVKIGLNSRLVFDGTYNPDFSHIEADAGQIDLNLRYALFYEEKRPFFLEGKELFSIGGSMMSDFLKEVVHTRTITDPVAGAKLTGGIGARGSFTALYAMDEDTPGGTDDRAHVSILRYRHALAQDSYLGGFGTSRETGARFNRVGGIDGRIRVGESSWIGMSAFYSRTRREESSPESGHAAGFNYDFSDRTWNFASRIRDISEGFDTEVGYLRRRGTTKIQSSLTRYLYPDSGIFLRIDPLLVSSFTLDKASGLWEHYNAAYAGASLPRNSILRIGGGLRSEVFAGREFDTSLFRVFFRSQATKRLLVCIDYRYCNKIRFVQDPYSGRGSQGTLSVIYQPTARFESLFDLDYSDFRRSSDGIREFEYTILRMKNTLQLNRHLFIRSIVEYDSFREELLSDALLSFTYIPGTVIHIGYGAMYDRRRPTGEGYIETAGLGRSRESLFFKTSYNWRF